MYDLISQPKQQIQPVAAAPDIFEIAKRGLSNAFELERNMAEALARMLIMVNPNLYSNRLLNIKLRAALASPLPGYRMYQDRHFIFSDSYWHWFILDGIIYPTSNLNTSIFGDRNYTWSSSKGLPPIHYIYTLRYRGNEYQLYAKTPLVSGDDIISLAANFTGLTLDGVIKKFFKVLSISSYEDVLNFNKPVNCRQEVSPAFGPPIERIAHYGLVRSGFKNDFRFVYRNPNGSFQGFVQLYSHKEYGGVFVPLTCWVHNDRPNDSQWVHLGFKKPMLWNIDKIEQYPEAKIFIFDNEFLATAFENKCHRNGIRNECIATTWPGGKHTLEQMDFLPLRGRQVMRVEENSKASNTLSNQMEARICAVTSNYTIKTAEEIG